MEISTAQPAGVLMPVSVTFAGQTVDMALPAQVPLAELLPGMVRALGRLTTEAATQGYRVLVPSGRALDQSRSLPDQGVRPGVLLTLEPTGTSLGDTRYDDIVEAVGAAIDAGQRPWRRGDSVQLSALCSVALFLVAAALLVTQARGSAAAGIVAAAGAVLVTLAAAVVARVRETGAEGGSAAPGGAAALALTAPALAACAAFVATDGPWNGLPLAAAGLAAMVGAAAVLVLPASERGTALGPLVAGGAMLLAGALTGLGRVPADHAAALTVALLAVVVVAAPWIGMAQVPARVSVVGAPAVPEIDGRRVGSRVRDASVRALSMKTGAVLVVVGLAPLVAGASRAGAALMICVGGALLLSTRSLHGRAEVLVGVLAGMATAVAAGIAATGAGLVPVAWAVAVVLGVGVLVLAANVVTQRMRPWLARLADAANILALVAILPLTVLVWGLL